MTAAWSVVKLGEVLRKSIDWIAIDPDQNYTEVTVKLWGKGVVQRRIAKGSEIAATRRSRVREGQFILSRIDARNGAIGVVPQGLAGAVVSNDFPSFDVSTQLLVPAFLGWMSKTAAFVDSCRAASEGTTNRVRLQEQRFLGQEIPLPPLEEQRRIVAKLDRIAAQSDGVAALQESIQSQTACLMSRIATELLALGRWDEASLGELLVEPSRNGLAARPSSSPPGVPILRISAGTSRPDARVEESDVRYLPLSSAQVEAYSLRPGDVLACRFNGNLEFVGRFSLFEGESRGTRVYPDKLIRFRVDPEKALPRFVVIAMNSKAGRDQIEHFCQTTAGNIGISATNLRTVKMPVPPMTAQRRIVEQLDTLQGKVGTLQELQTEARREVGALMPAILDRAFRGEL